MHLEETLQLSLDEKEDIIKALQTQVNNFIYKFTDFVELYSVVLLYIFYIASKQ